MIQNNIPKGNKLRRKRRRFRKRIKFLLFLAVMLFFALGAYGIHLYMKAGSVVSDAYEDAGREKSDLRDEVVDPKFDNVSILIMGVDENESRKKDGPTRTDALIVVTLNRDGKSVKMLSIPRDSYVYIPEIGYEDKINHAHAFGGTKATIETVENLLDIPIDYYVKINFDAFVEVIDAIGGVEVDVPYEIYEMDSQDRKSAIHLMEGRQVLNGEEALAFVRTRKKDNDFERGKRQMEVIDAIIKKATSFSSFFKYDDIIEAVGNNMTTNMTFAEMKSFFAYATEGANLYVEKLTLEGEDYKPASVYYWKINEESLAEISNTLKGHLELPSYVDSTSEFDNQLDENSEYNSNIDYNNSGTVNY